MVGLRSLQWVAVLVLALFAVVWGLLIAGELLLGLLVGVLFVFAGLFADYIREIRLSQAAD